MEELKISTASNNAVKQRAGGKPATKALDIIITGSIYLIFFLCPLFFTGFVNRGMDFEKMVLFYFLVLLGTVAWVTKGVVKGELEFKRTPLDLPIISMVVIFIVSTFFSINTKDSLVGAYSSSAKSLVAIAIFALFYYLVVNNINRKKIKSIFFLLVASSSLIIVYSFMQLLGFFILPMSFTKFPEFNPLSSLSGLTMFLTMILPLLVVAVAQVKEIYPKLNNIFVVFIKFFAGLIVLIGLTVLVFLNGFTFWPVAIVGAVILLMFFLSKIVFIKNNNLIIPLAFFLLLIIFLVLGNFNIINLNLPAEVNLSRGISLDIAKRSLAENPILGSGPSTFYYDFSQFKGAGFNSSPLWNTRFNSSTGALFELASTVGSIGILAFVVVILIAISICFLALIKINEKELHSVILALFASFVIAILFAILFALNNSLILISVLISVLTVSSAVIVYPEKFKTIKLSFRTSPKYALALATIFLCVSAGVVVLFTMGLKMYLADIYVKQAFAEQSIDEKINKLNKAVVLFPYEDSYYIELANLHMVLVNQEVNGARDQAKIENNLSRAIEFGKKAIEISPNKAYNNESLSLIYENASFYTRGALEWAENLYNKLIELEPDNPVPHLRMALINMARANAEEDKEEKAYYINEAIKKYDEAIAKKDDLSPAYYGKAIAFEALNNQDEAIEQLKKAVILDRNNIDYRFELGRLYFNRGVYQINLSQTATEEIAEEESDDSNLSVEANQPTGGVVESNDDLKMAEEIFYSVLQLNSNHANALYSLGLLYQKTGRIKDARIAIDQLLTIITDKETVKEIKNQFPELY